eukprot:CAMPEP_0195025378 /NCGR_PEP_ID=MMETSP0326_2-20130528/47656_1 /TAXON_ID=2866 ORGANISM="Crypthecodinium cohnii, Strain Seligo" /NCGR_SAMPLE_ID=MMETSP0326_2 /ASSEMBLY_ACC=CAM_ASM_000348 /LENGTH=101 /DNA_ID=CAMNT_0040046707 /DNA_START=157 /DNA_END=459 /DNA_ORIENTATION=+
MEKVGHGRHDSILWHRMGRSNWSRQRKANINEISTNDHQGPEVASTTCHRGVAGAFVDPVPTEMIEFLDKLLEVLEERPATERWTQSSTQAGGAWKDGTSK